MKDYSLGLKEKVNELANEIIFGIERMEEDIKFEHNHKQTLCFLIFRFGPDIVLEAMPGITLENVKYFINRLRQRCARLYQTLYERKV